MNRREIVTSVIGLVLGVSSAHGAKPERMKPQVGDVLVYAFGENVGNKCRCREDVRSMVILAIAKTICRGKYVKVIFLVVASTCNTRSLSSCPILKRAEGFFTVKSAK